MIRNGTASFSRHIASFGRPRTRSRRCLTTTTGGSDHSGKIGNSIATLENLASRLEELAPSIAESLVDKGYYTTIPLLDRSVIQTLREQAIGLREEGRYEQSWSESIQADGKVVRFDKPGVFACEPDGADYETAPDLITYMSYLITTLPPALNEHLPEDVASISNQAFNAKLAVTESHSEYPLHVDNSLGTNGGDSRKLTCILYLNPNYDQGLHQGELRVHLLGGDYVDLEPSTRFVCFWTDEIPHKVLMTGGGAGADGNGDTMDRYALTIWLADDDPRHIHNPNSKFADLRIHAFDSKTEE